MVIEALAFDIILPTDVYDSVTLFQLFRIAGSDKW